MWALVECASNELRCCEGSYSTVVANGMKAGAATLIEVVCVIIFVYVGVLCAKIKTVQVN